jgi:prevent-host-death family protein
MEDRHMATRVTTLEVRQRLGDLLNRVALRDDEYIIERKGEPLAALVPVARLRALEQLAREEMKRAQAAGSAVAATQDRADRLADEAKHASRRGRRDRAAEPTPAYGRGSAARGMGLNRITQDPAVMNGQPCIRGMRLTVKRLVEALAACPDRQPLRAEYPEVEDEDIRQALAFVASLVDDGGAARRPLSVVPVRTTVDDVFGCLSFTGRALTLEEMEAAVAAEARRHR